jgi:hypothetical protein
MISSFLFCYPFGRSRIDKKINTQKRDPTVMGSDVAGTIA